MNLFKDAIKVTDAVLKFVNIMYSFYVMDQLKSYKMFERFLKKKGKK